MQSRPNLSATRLQEQYGPQALKATMNQQRKRAIVFLVMSQNTDNTIQCHKEGRNLNAPFRYVDNNNINLPKNKPTCG